MAPPLKLFSAEVGGGVCAFHVNIVKIATHRQAAGTDTGTERPVTEGSMVLSCGTTSSGTRNRAATEGEHSDRDHVR